MSGKMKTSFIMKHYNEILNDPMYKAMIKTGKVTRYQHKEVSKVDSKFSLSIVSGITDVPALEDVGYFEVAIMKEYPKRKVMKDACTMVNDIKIIDAVCDFEQVWKIQKKFRDDPYKLWFKQLTKGERRR